MFWLILVFTSFSFGTLVVHYLVSGTGRISPSLAGAGFLFLTTDIQVAALVANEGLLAVPVALLSTLAGYIFMTVLVMRRQEKRTVPALARSKGCSGRGHRAVIYLTHGESPEYDPQSWINQFREFDQARIRFIPYLARPLFLFRLRRHYQAVGKSLHRQTHERMLQALEESYRSEGDSATRFYLAFLDDQPHADEAVIQALNDGASEIIVSLVFLTTSNHTAEGKAIVERLNVKEMGASLRFTRPLWDSALLQRMFVEKVNAASAEINKECVGVLLVGHGQPPKMDGKYSSETDQETAFRNGILRQLVLQCYSQKNLENAWMEFREPRPATFLRDFARRGVEMVITCATAMSADGIHSQYDIPNLVKKARLPNDVRVVNLGGWNDHPLVIRAIKERIDEIEAA